MGRDNNCELVGYYTTKIVHPAGSSIVISYKPGCMADGVNDAGYCEPLIDMVAADDGRQLAFEYKVVYSPDTYLLRFQVGKITGPLGKYVEYFYENLSKLGGAVTALSAVQTSEGYSWRYAYYVPESMINPRCNVQISCEAKGWDLFLRQAVGRSGAARDYEWTVVPIHRQFGGDLPIGLSTKTIGSDIWRYSYRLLDDSSAIMETSINGPRGREVFRHWSDRYSGGPRGLNPPEWRAGLLVAHEVAGLEATEYVWAGQPLSDDWRNLVDASWTWDGRRHSPVLTKRRVVRDGVVYEEEYSSFDAFGRALMIISRGPNGARRSAVRTYWNSDGGWILDRLASETVTVD